MGTPEFAVPTLTKLIAWTHGCVLAVVAQPDRPAGRGRKVQQPPTKILAEKHGVQVFQPEKLSRSPEIVEAMRALRPDVLVTAAFGQILRRAVLELAPYGVVNLHGSLLPKYRGAAPINWAIINGETVTGVTTLFSDEGIDTGPMLLKRQVAIGADSTAEDLNKLLAEIGASVVVETLEAIKTMSIKPEPQDNSQATYAPMLKKELGQIDWSSPSASIHNLVRGLVPWPGTYTYLNSVPLKVVRTALTTKTQMSQVVPGQVVSIGEQILVSAGGEGKELIQLLEVQMPSRPKMSAREWANGVHLRVGTVLG
ncbi:MAG: methionyl-tRNA formyltransferase [Candidatus Melainabacteria bacterium]|nr:methionyl-tRNA formyltransferase [Candidatus Melainabacteria bacterium]